MSVVTLLFAVGLATQGVFALLMVAFARMAGVAVKVVQIGSPPLLKFKLGSRVLQLGPVPGASVTMADFEQLPLARRLLVRLGPWVILLGIAIALLGPEHALRSFARTFEQLFVIYDLTPLLERFLHFARTAPIVTIVGVLLAKQVAFNLLPLTTLAGGAAVDDVLRAWRGKGTPTWWVALSLLIVLIWVCGRLVWALIDVI